MVGGLVLFAVSTSANGWQFQKLSAENLETNTYTVTDPFESISIETNTADIVFTPSPDGKCQVVCYEHENARHEVKLTGSTLTVTEINRKEWYEHIGIYTESPKIQIFLPGEACRDLFIADHTGDIRIPADFRFGSVDIQTSTGDVQTAASVTGHLRIATSTGHVRLTDAAAGSIDLSVSTGHVDVQNVTCDGDLSVRVNTGKSLLTDVSCANFTSTGSTGKLELKQVTASGSFSITRSTGDVEFDRCDAAQITVETDTGDVEGSFLSPKIFFTETDTGDIDVPKSTSGGTCSVTTDTGDIELALLP